MAMDCTGCSTRFSLLPIRVLEQSVLGPVSTSPRWRLPRSCENFNTISFPLLPTDSPHPLPPILHTQVLLLLLQKKKKGLRKDWHGAALRVSANIRINDPQQKEQTVLAFGAESQNHPPKYHPLRLPGKQFQQSKTKQNKTKHSFTTHSNPLPTT